ncbi:MAG TPA: DUF2812 domain-containing protein [Firmicutes bacterium]|jgi:hypothetical protein|nr:DUF2812 domain-containing protein [Bacillota bacterium]
MAKRVFRPFWSYDVTATEQWLADMAASGLLLQAANFKKRVFTFIEAEPQKIIYRIDYDKEGRGLSQTLTGCGWGMVATGRQWVIYANKDTEVSLFPQRDRVIAKTRSLAQSSAVLLGFVGVFLLISTGITASAIWGSGKAEYASAPYPILDYFPYFLIILNISFFTWVIYMFIKTRKSLKHFSAASGFSVDPTLADFPNQWVQVPGDLSGLIKKKKLFWIYNLERTMDWLETQAGKGLLLKQIRNNSFFFEKTEPKHLKYFFDTQQSINEGYFDIHLKAGFNLLYDSRLQFGRLLLWSKQYSPGEPAPKMYTDKKEHLASARRLLMNNLKTIAYWLLLGAIQLFVGLSSIYEQINRWVWMPITGLWIILMVFHLIVLFMAVKSYMQAKQKMAAV